MVTGTRRIAFCERQFPFLFPDVCGSTVFRKQNCSSRARLISPRTLLHVLAAAERYPWRDIVCVLLIFNKSLGTSSPIGLLLSCVIDRLILVALLLPLLFLLRSRAVLTSSATCKLSSLLETTCKLSSLLERGVVSYRSSLSQGALGEKS